MSRVPVEPARCPSNGSRWLGRDLRHLTNQGSTWNAQSWTVTVA